MPLLLARRSRDAENLVGRPKEATGAQDRPECLRARLQRLDLRQVSLGEHVWNKLEGWTLDRVPREYPTSIDGVLGVMSLGCTRVRFDFERSEFGCSR